MAWIYHDAALPRRWVSVNGDPTNQTPPFQTVDVALNLWGVIEGEADAFYETSAKLPRLGEHAGHDPERGLRNGGRGCLYVVHRYVF